MDLIIRRVGEAHIASFARRTNLEGATSVQFKERLKAVIAQGARRVVVDLSEVGFIDSQGLGALISAFKILRQENGTLVLANLSDPVDAILKITRLIRVFEVHESVEAAVGAAGGTER